MCGDDERGDTVGTVILAVCYVVDVDLFLFLLFLFALDGVG